MTPELLISIVALLLLIVSGWLIVFAVRWQRYQHRLQQDDQEAKFLERVIEACGSSPLKLRPATRQEILAIERTVKELKEKAGAK
jgi:hypothetical protein